MSAIILGHKHPDTDSIVSAIACTDLACQMPVLRPVIGMDKNEIVKIAYQIDTFETSILPYEDCCTVFTPKHPRTRPDLKFVRIAEEALDVEGLVEKCVKETHYIKIGYKEQN